MKNFKKQIYGDLILTQCDRKYGDAKARRFRLFDTVQAIWIPCVYLESDGTIKKTSNIDWIFRSPNKQNIVRIAKATRKEMV